jgi:hypothetical protein
MGLKWLISGFEFNSVLQHKKNFGMVFIYKKYSMEIDMIILYWQINVLCVFGIILLIEGTRVLSVTSYVLVTGMSTNNLEYDLSTVPTISILANIHKPHSIP